MAWDPIKDINKIRKEMERSFNILYKTVEKSVREVNKGINRTFNLKEPKTEISQDLNKITVVIELPGMNKKNISLKITEDHLEVFAEKHKKLKKSKKIEESYNGYKRVITLPSNVIPSKAVAVYKDDKLIVKIPKSKKKVVKEVTVN
ncbi:MAG: Hsp20/alpha crystallin family protein [Candidatus Nanoarchaeia archaeon]|nr:Hsp20/alpha crystallin family protein [Candidatus Nanoarchaeia archaeon]